MADGNNDNYFDVYGQEGNGDLSTANGNGENQETTIDNSDAMIDDSDLQDIKQRVKGMDEEAARLLQLQNEMEQQMKTTSSPTTNFGNQFSTTPMSAEEKFEADSRSIYVGNVDYSATAQELEAHFHGCGSINRVTILCDKFSGHPKGFAYVEFGDKDSVQTAMALDESLFKGRQIKVVCKRTNKPGISSTDRFPRGGGRGSIPMGGYMGGRGRGGISIRGAYNPYMRSMRGRVVKGGGRGFYNYSPY